MNLCKSCLYSCKNVASANICEKYIESKNFQKIYVENYDFLIPIKEIVK